MHEPVPGDGRSRTINMIRHGRPLADVPEREAALIHLARGGAGRSRLRQRRTRQPWRFLATQELLHYSVLIASYAQVAILLCIVGQELHDHQSPGLPEQERH